MTKDGTDRWFRGSAVAHLGPDGTVQGYTGTAQLLSRDVDEVLRRSAGERHVRDLLTGDSVRIVFQPIISTETGRMVGAEALSRFRPPAPTPDVVFAEAAAVGLGVELELLAVRKALRAAAALPKDLYVSVNVSPETLLDGRLGRDIEDGGLPSARLVLEITEHVSIEDYEQLAGPLQALRAGKRADGRRRRRRGVRVLPAHPSAEP